MTDGATIVASIVDAGKPKLVLEEVHRTLAGIVEKDDLHRLDQVIYDVQRLFAGRYPGYSKCNTRYHDLEHTTDTLLAMGRLIHEAVEAGRAIERRTILLGLLHDTGYIQTDDDRLGTGAKYTAGHIFRSIKFAMEYSTLDRFGGDLGGVSTYMQNHFRTRWGSTAICTSRPPRRTSLISDRSSDAPGLMSREFREE